MDDFADPKVQFLIFKDKEYGWRCSNYPFRHAETFHCAEKTVYGMSLVVLDIENIENNIVKELGICKNGQTGYGSFCMDYFLHTPKFLDYMQFCMTLQEL